MLQFIGIGSAFHTALGNNNAFIKKGENLFLIDCGSTNFSRIIEKGVLNGVKHITILQTHLHADHVGSLGDLVGYAFNVMEPKQSNKVTIITPKALTEDVKVILAKEGVPENQYTSIEIEDSYSPENLLGITYIKPYQVQHVPHLKCFAYLLEIDGRKVYYSGDCNMVPDDILEEMLAGNIDLFYQDTSKADFEGNVHLSLRKLTELIPEQLRNRVYCMHLDQAFSVEEANELGFRVVQSI
ncbi:ribonuclease Z [Bacillus sp. AGMB 02131]|uniref:Ribonuclease Z n=1 Tax=Peribacillus faecalis TaxID=2772559 RepID=A0A927CVJ3_9BACI|nr:MBL fold metallo-hydrolase [Peribacillus faecalis]MBD3108587.1 ribonuclease Z [Peribacillus faecalis]